MDPVTPTDEKPYTIRDAIADGSMTADDAIKQYKPYTIRDAISDGSMTADQAIEKYREPTMGERLQGAAGHAVQALTSAVGATESTALHGLSMLFNGEDDSDPFEQLSGAVAKSSQEPAIPIPPQSANIGFAGKLLGETIPSMAGGLAGMMAIPVPGAAGPRAAMAIRGAIVTGSQQFVEAKAAGAPEEKAWEAFIAGAGVGGGSMYISPLGKLFAKSDAASGGALTNAVWQGVKSGFEGVTATSLYQLGTNVIAQHTSDPERKLMEGLGQAAAAGGLTGVFAGVVDAHAAKNAPKVDSAATTGGGEPSGATVPAANPQAESAPAGAAPTESVVAIDRDQLGAQGTPSAVNPTEANIGILKGKSADETAALVPRPKVTLEQPTVAEARPEPQQGPPAPVYEPDDVTAERRSIKSAIEGSPELTAMVEKADPRLHEAVQDTMRQKVSPERVDEAVSQITTGAEYPERPSGFGSESDPATSAPVPEPETQIRPTSATSAPLKPEHEGFVGNVLGAVDAKGDPGLSSKARSYKAGALDVSGHEIVYRAPDGSPVAAARVVERDGKLFVADFATDKSKGLLASRAAVAVGRELKRIGATEPNGTITPDAAKFKEHGEGLGIAHRVTEARGEDAPRGEGSSPEEILQRGRALLAKGRTPESALANYDSNRAVSSDDVAIARAHAEKLQHAADVLADKEGTSSKAYLEAKGKATAWIEKIKPLSTEVSESFRAHQGASGLEPDTFHAMARAYSTESGKEFTPGQETKARIQVRRNQEANAAADVKQAKLYDALDKFQARDPKAVSSRVAELDARIAAKVKEIGKLATRARSGLDTDLLKAVAEHAGLHIQRVGLKFAEWAKEMIDKHGPGIQAYLKPAWDRATFEHERDITAHQAGTKMTPERSKALWDYARKNYIDKAVPGHEPSFSDIAHGLAGDFGLPVDDVRRGLAPNPGIRKLTDEMYNAQANRRNVREAAKAWVREQAKPGWQRALEKTPRTLFTAKVAGHGTVGLLTHPGQELFNPDPAMHAAYRRNFVAQYKYMLDPAFHEAAMQDLVRDPLFTTAKRAGLANDPRGQFGDYERNIVTDLLGKVGLAGGRGFDALKRFRQDKFNIEWQRQPDSMRTPEWIKATADSINHATGFVRGGGGIGSQVASTIFFAPKLWAARGAYLFADPARAAKTLLNYKNEPPEMVARARKELFSKGLTAGTMLSALAINQALTKDKINFTDPDKSDWLKFKMFGHDVSFVGSMVHDVAYIYRVAEATAGLQKRGTISDAIKDATADEARRHLSPIASDATDLVTRQDAMGRQLPHSNKKEPKYLELQGIHPYTWPEYAGQALLPIPAEEAVKEAMSPKGFDLLKTIIIAAINSTGTRVTESREEEPK